MRMIVTDTGEYVNHRLECLKTKGKELCVIKLEPSTKDIDARLKVMDISADKANIIVEKRCMV